MDVPLLQVQKKERNTIEFQLELKGNYLIMSSSFQKACVLVIVVQPCFRKSCDAVSNVNKNRL